MQTHLPSMLSFLYQAEPQNVDEGRRDDKVSMEVRVHHGPHRDQCLGSSDPAALGQEEVAHPHLFTNPGPLVPPVDLVRKRLKEVKNEKMIPNLLFIILIISKYLLIQN